MVKAPVSALDKPRVRPRGRERVMGWVVIRFNRKTNHSPTSVRRTFGERSQPSALAQNDVFAPRIRTHAKTHVQQADKRLDIICAKTSSHHNVTGAFITDDEFATVEPIKLFDDFAQRQ